MSKRSREGEEEDAELAAPAAKEARTEEETEQKSSAMAKAAETLLAGFERAAENLVTALDTGTIKPHFAKYDNGASTVAIYVVRWCDEPLKEMADVAKHFGYDHIQTLFSDMFGEVCPFQLQDGGDGTEAKDAFVFRFNYGDTWEQHRAREARYGAEAEAKAEDAARVAAASTHDELAHCVPK